MYNTPVYIYALINPICNQIFYIGATAYPKERLSAHISKIKTDLKSIEVSKIISAGLKPEMEILDECEIKTARFFECFYIDLFSSYGFTLLQNRTSTYTDKINSFTSTFSSKVEITDIAIVQYLADGFIVKEISDLTGVNVKTIEMMVRKLRETTGTKTAAHLVAKYFKLGLITVQ